MKTESENKRFQRFLYSLVAIALIINSLCFEKAARSRISSQQQQQKEQAREQQQQLETENAAAAQKATQDAAENHAAYLAQYVSAGPARIPGTQTVGIAAESEDGKLNRAVTAALIGRFQPEPVNIAHAFFKPAFVSDGLFNDAFAGTGDILNKLDLAKSLDALLLARQDVQYSSNPALENVITATMQLNVVVLPVTGQNDSRSWTFIASGAGFKQAEARAMAEERLIKQITTDTNMTFN